MKNGDWSFFIFILLLMCYFTLDDIKSEMKAQTNVGSEKVSTIDKPDQIKEVRELAIKADIERNQALAAQPFKMVPAEQKVAWVKVNLDNYHPLAFLGLLSIFAVGACVFTKRLLGE